MRWVALFALTLACTPSVSTSAFSPPPPPPPGTDVGCAGEIPMPPDPLPPDFDYTPLAETWCAQLAACGLPSPTCVQAYLREVEQTPPPPGPPTSDQGVTEWQCIDSREYEKDPTFCEKNGPDIEGATPSSFAFQNSGSSAFRIASVGDEDLTYEITKPDGSKSEGVLAPGAGEAIAVRASCKSTPSGEGTYTITSNDKDAPDRTKTVSVSLECTSDSWGDPHLTTLDGTRYDFQRVGEFVLAAGTDFAVQVRQAPFGRSKKVAINTAVVARVGKTRIGFYTANEELVSVDGKPRALAVGEHLLGGQSVTRMGSYYTIAWPSGARLRVRDMGDHLDVVMKVPPGTKMRGLLASATPTPDTWRIKQKDSLFDYAKGETTATFTDRTFPHHSATTDTLSDADHAAAAKVCRDAGVTDPHALDACILDVATTGDPTYADSAVVAAARGDLRTIAATANLYAAGQSSTKDGTLPVLVTVPVGARTIAFPQVTGLVMWNAGSKIMNGPEGGPHWAPTDVKSEGGISAVKHPRTLFLAGVFLTSSSPVAPPPPPLDHAQPGAAQSPAIAQVFYIGDGRDPQGALAQIAVPAGATRLYLGFADAADGAAFKGRPGWYRDNGGELQATYAFASDLSRPPSANPESEDAPDLGLTGTWRSREWGDITFVQKGRRVYGIYDHDQGQFDGYVVGDELRFWWWEKTAPGTSWSDAAEGERGDGFFRVTAGRLDGAWRYARDFAKGAPTRRWEGRKQPSKPRPYTPPRFQVPPGAASW